MSEGKDQEGTSAQDESPEGDAQDQPIENTEISVDGGRDESSPQDGVQGEEGEALEGPLVMSLPELTFPQEQSASLVINYGDHEARVAYLLDGVPQSSSSIERKM